MHRSVKIIVAVVCAALGEGACGNDKAQTNPAADAATWPWADAGPDGGTVAGDGNAPTVAARYLPDVPLPYDGKYLAGGSFEETLGFEWDQCFTRTAGRLPARVSGGAAESDHFMQFQSGGCSLPCDPGNPSLSQLFMWFDKVAPTSDPMGLYFDMINLGDPAPSVSPGAAAPEGSLGFFGVDLACGSEAPLTEVALPDLQLDGTWQTRCVDLPGVGLNDGVGFAVSGVGPFNVGLDALRLGPPCHRPVDCTKVACVCSFGANQTCNDNPIIASLHGGCQTGGTCVCHPGFEKNAATGKCR